MVILDGLLGMRHLSSYSICSKILASVKSIYVNCNFTAWKWCLLQGRESSSTRMVIAWIVLAPSIPTGQCSVLELEPKRTSPSWAKKPPMATEGWGEASRGAALHFPVLNGWPFPLEPAKGLSFLCATGP